MNKMKLTILIGLFMLAAVVLSGCGVVGYEAKEKATFKGERILVTVETYGAAVKKDINDLAIIVFEDPNGLNELSYIAKGRALAGESHSPEALAEQVVKGMELLPADFWVTLINRIAGATETVIETKAAEPNSP